MEYSILARCAEGVCNLQSLELMILPNYKYVPITYATLKDLSNNYVESKWEGTGWPSVFSVSWWVYLLHIS